MDRDWLSLTAGWWCELLAPRYDRSHANAIVKVLDGCTQTRVLKVGGASSTAIVVVWAARLTGSVRRDLCLF
jgi:putative NADH-flavin reductase